MDRKLKEMFLTQDNHSVKDFLQSLNFIAPQGMSIAYFITPQSINLPNNSGFEAQNSYDEDESQIYTRTLPIEKIDQAQSPGEFSQWQPDELKRRMPTPNILPDITEPDDLDSPFVKILSESRLLGVDLKLLESYGIFPKNTVFHCVEKKLKESGEY